MAVSQKKLGIVQELNQELSSLRSSFDSIVEKYSLNVKAQLDELLEKLSEKNVENEEQPLPKKKALDKVLAKVQKLKLKPEKGRIKDIMKIQAVLKDLVSIFSVK
jgi:hypothetical protein